MDDQLIQTVNITFLPLDYEDEWIFVFFFKNYLKNALYN